MPVGCDSPCASGTTRSATPPSSLFASTGAGTGTPVSGTGGEITGCALAVKPGAISRAASARA